MAILSRPCIRAAALTCALLVAGPTATAFAKPAPAVARSDEYALKAAFLFNFARFVEWPADAFANATTPITIGILGDDPFGSGLDDMVAGEAVHGRKLAVRRFASAEDVGNCQILYVAAGEPGHATASPARLGGRGILTVGDGSDFTAQDGMIGFEMVHDHLRLRINLAAARAAKLTISSQLLRQAKIVGPEVAP